MSPRSFRRQLEELESRVLLSANPAIRIGDLAVVEGNSGSEQVVLTANLSAPSTKTVKVDYKSIDGTARAGSDYAAVSGTLTFAPGQTRASIPVLVHGDTQVEPNESFSIKLRNARNATIADSTGVVTILDDGDGLPQISISDADAVEGSFLTFTVSLSVPSSQTVMVDYHDSWGALGTLTFAPGEQFKTISIGTLDDDVYEPRYDQVTLFNASPNARILDGEGFGSVYDNDPNPSAGSTPPQGWLIDASGSWYNPTAASPDLNW